MASTQITPGRKVQITVVKTPTSRRAAKTLVRLLSKDPAAKADTARHRKIRTDNYNPEMRGGRLYGGRVVKLHTLHGQPGESGTITATLDVLRDLNSVQRFVEVKQV